MVWRSCCLLSLLLLLCLRVALCAGLVYFFLVLSCDWYGVVLVWFGLRRRDNVFCACFFVFGFFLFFLFFLFFYFNSWGCAVVCCVQACIEGRDGGGGGVK